jgi:hypothetical protein
LSVTFVTTFPANEKRVSLGLDTEAFVALSTETPSEAMYHAVLAPSSRTQLHQKNSPVPVPLP